MEGGVLHAANLAPGHAQSFTLPASHLAPDNMLVLLADWLPEGPADVQGLAEGLGTFFVAYRQRQGLYDSQIPYLYAGERLGCRHQGRGGAPV